MDPRRSWLRANRGSFAKISYCSIDNLRYLDYGSVIGVPSTPAGAGGMPSDGPQDDEIGPKKSATATRPRSGDKANSRRRGSAAGLAAILESALDEPAVAEDGSGRRPSKREMVIRRLVEKSAGADLAATKLLLDLLGKAELEARTAAPGDAEPAFSQDALDRVKERLARLAAAAAAAQPPDPTAPPDGSGEAAGEAIEAEERKAP